MKPQTKYCLQHMKINFPHSQEFMVSRIFSVVTMIVKLGGNCKSHSIRDSFRYLFYLTRNLLTVG